MVEKIRLFLWINANRGFSFIQMHLHAFYIIELMREYGCSCVHVNALTRFSINSVHSSPIYAGTLTTSPSHNHVVRSWLERSLFMFWFTACAPNVFFLPLRPLCCLQRLSCFTLYSGGGQLADRGEMPMIWDKNEIALKPFRIAQCTFKCSAG